MRFQKIKTELWFDEKFCSLNSREKLLFLYFLTCPHTNLIGLYVVKEGYICSDLQILSKDLRKDLTKLLEKDLVKYDFKASVVYIPNFLKHNPLTNPNQKKAAKKILKSLPKSPLISMFCEGLPEGLKEVLTEGLSKVLLKPEEEEEEEKEEEEEDKKIIARSDNDPSEQAAVISIPLATNGEFFDVTESHVKEWQELFPAIDIMQTLRNIKAWNIANPKNRKTKKGIVKHITTWMMRDQDSARKPKGSSFEDELHRNFEEAKRMYEERERKKKQGEGV
jgi:hypothetical protein